MNWWVNVGRFCEVSNAYTVVIAIQGPFGTPDGFVI